jgi:hypothetical protein
LLHALLNIDKWDILRHFADESVGINCMISKSEHETCIKDSMLGTGHLSSFMIRH